MALTFDVDGRSVAVADEGGSLLEVLRDRLGLRSAKDGCSPQGQCGCCTVLIDGQPRVACVTPARRVAGRTVTTLDGLDPEVRAAWGEAFCAAGASQCGFCTPGIIVRLAALPDRSPGAVEQALLAHLCRCTGWRTIVDAATGIDRGTSPGAGGARDLAAASRRATIEGGTPQRVSPGVGLGAGGFADDTAPLDALVAVADGSGGWAVGETLSEARAVAGKVQGRRTTIGLSYPLEVPPGDWAVTLRTTWVEPAYLEPDASWCQPGGEPVTPLANGGAFGGKSASPAPAAARRLADEHGRAVRVLLSREDVVRLGPKRPPVAAGMRADGTGLMRVVRTPGFAEAVASVAPGLEVHEVDVSGPPTLATIRAAGWAEAAALLAAVRGRGAGGQGPVTVTSPAGATATVTMAGPAPAGGGPAGPIHVWVACGRILDATVLRSYCIGAVHMGLGWVTSEGIAVDADGRPRDLTVRSFGVLRARDTPEVMVDIVEGEGPPVNGSDAVFAATAAAAWLGSGLVSSWPTRPGRTT